MVRKNSEPISFAYVSPVDGVVHALLQGTRRGITLFIKKVWLLGFEEIPAGKPVAHGMREPSRMLADTSSRRQPLERNPAHIAVIAFGDNEIAKRIGIHCPNARDFG